MCNSFWLLDSHQTVEIERWAPCLQIEKDQHRMSQDLSDQTLLKVPYIQNPYAGNRKALGQVRANRFDTFANALTGFQQLRVIARGHAFTRSCYHQHALALFEQSLANGINKAFIGWRETAKPSKGII